jgi:hypothetical protein
MLAGVRSAGVAGKRLSQRADLQPKIFSKRRAVRFHAGMARKPGKVDFDKDC